MGRIAGTDWSFEKIRVVDDARATRLESLGPPEDLVGSLADALHQAINRNEFRIAVDSKKNAFTELRAIVQFQVDPHLYDWFFNGRTGYRAQFWIRPEVGISFNGRIAEALAEVLLSRLAATVTVQCIEVEFEGGARVEKDAGAMQITLDELLRSLAPDASKIWMGERLYGADGGPVTNIDVVTLRDAAQSPAKLHVPRWAEATNPETGEMGEGLRAPLPRPEYSWL